MSNLTDKEIEMALECCTNPKVGKECPRAKFVDVCNDGCINILMRQAYELIIRKNAEIEILTGEMDCLVKMEHDNLYEQTQKIKKAKAESVKEFVERLKTNHITKDDKGKVHLLIEYDEFDNLVKEMAGGVE